MNGGEDDEKKDKDGCRERKNEKLSVHVWERMAQTICDLLLQLREKAEKGSAKAEIKILPDGATNGQTFRG